MFNNLLFSNFELLKYNNFFKFNLKLLKYQHFFFLFNSFLKKFNINMVIVLDYKNYYLYFQFFNLMGLSLFSFVNNYNFIKYLDYYHITNSFFNLEKIFFLSKILQIYNFYCLKKRIFFFDSLCKN